MFFPFPFHSSMLKFCSPKPKTPSPQVTHIDLGKSRATVNIQNQWTEIDLNSSTESHKNQKKYPFKVGKSTFYC